MAQTQLSEQQLMALLTDDKAMAALANDFAAFKIRGADERMPLPTPEAAVAYAERVIHASQWASPDYYATRPYQVEDLGDKWKVSGSGTQSPLFGPLVVVLSKTDASLLSYGLTWKDGSLAVAPPLKP